MAFDLTILTMAKGLARHSAARQGLVAENVANADTVGYRARDLRPFAEVYEERRAAATGSPPAAERASAGFSTYATRPGHHGYDPAGARAVVARPAAAEPQVLSRLGADSPNGNSVSIEDQMARGAAATAHHQMALAVLRTAGAILRASIGRG